ncbi:ATP-dependent DNA ligase [Pelagicoccus sp. SDUM812003]|uniref:ATP-dependent DNA ligase n=1 Tax=Pelagicoccus sp. SDUM812003 TaxID=3041267 RepID=UPI00281055F5|nr:ATP-dependent DNA ligase [Pelagicoccus sp. SDUM812003]MDQ8203126.1 ATP-dependent DNA ligase [Pelagicoccus sp. SDUM812003]
MTWKLEQQNGIYLPDLDWHLDARKPVARSFVSHAHFDHMGDHETILCSAPTAQLIRDRLPGERQWQVHAFGEAFEFAPGVTGTLHPAGHIIGSAMLRLERDGQSLLYSGDFKLTAGISAEACQPVAADTLIVETTYGVPRYTFPPESEVIADIIRFARESIENGETPVLFGYSLGKSQEILRALADSDLQAMLHPQSYKLTESCATLGWEFPDFQPFDPSDHEGKVLICPPMARNASWLKKVRKPKTAIISGWAIDPSAVYRYQCDKAFPLSDHADYLDLQSFVAQVAPKTVFTVHGFAQEFAATLREQGYEAWALGKENQLSLDIPEEKPDLSDAFPNSDPLDPDSLPLDSFARLAATAATLGETDSKNRKVEILSGYLSKLDVDSAALASLFLTGRPFPQASSQRLNIGWSLVRQSILLASGSSEADFKTLYDSLRDSSEVAARLLAKLQVKPTRTLTQIASFFDGLAAAPSPAFRQSLLSEEFRKLTPEEGKLLMKIISGDLRIGLKEGLVEEALAATYGLDKEELRKANLRSGNLLTVARHAARDALQEIRLTPFHPLQFMLASPEANAEAIVARLGDAVWTEDKYDGIRCQIHKVGERAELYSRDLNRITHQFPELAEAARQIPQDFIADGEVVAWGYERPLPFSELQKRLGRKGEDLFLGEEIPVILWLYDLLWFENEDLLDAPLENRRRKLDTFSVNPKARIAPVSILSSPQDIEAEFAAARARGNEGLMLKDPSSAYLPGRRGLSWLKLKKAYATIDVVVVAAEYGHGKRKDVLSDYTFAVRDESDGSLKTIGKAYTGLTNAQIDSLTERFLANTIEDEGRLKRVVPDTVLEIAFDSIRESKRHDSGLALRFPRIKRIRTDKTVEQIDTLAQCRRLLEAGQQADAVHRPE